MRDDRQLPPELFMRRSGTRHLGIAVLTGV